MALEYRLILAGHTPTDEVAVRTASDPAERPAPSDYGEYLSVNLRDTRGFTLSVISGDHGYYGADSDDGVWEWEPDGYVDLTFRINKEEIDKGTENMLHVVARVLNSGSEDAALMLNGDVLLLTRFDGVIRKHGRAKWWTSYDDFANDIIPD